LPKKGRPLLLCGQQNLLHSNSIGHDGRNRNFCLAYDAVGYYMIDKDSAAVKDSILKHIPQLLLCNDFSCQSGSVIGRSLYKLFFSSKQ